MKPVRSKRNQYPGINAHLHSYWQSEGGWNNFHNRHVGDMAGLLRQELLPIGYTAVMEESLQIRRVGDALHQPRADILVSDRDAERARQPSSATQVGVTVAELIEAVEDEKPYSAIAIYELEEAQHGEPVAWIELLSPTNKGHEPDAQTYVAKRQMLLKNRLVFVEIDYLHETPPTFSSQYMPDYSNPDRRAEGAHPYRIVVLDPRPDMKTGPTQRAEFDVDEPLPTVSIPLNAGESLEFDFGVPCQKTFEEMAYGLELVDYSQLPPHFERYGSADQTRIALRMLAVLEAAHNGVDLESGPFPLKDMPLEAALKAIGG